MRVVDRDGVEIVVGSMVERDLGDRNGGVLGVVTHARKQIDVTWAPASLGPRGNWPPLSLRHYGTERIGLRTRRCNALVRRSTAQHHSNPRTWRDG